MSGISLQTHDVRFLFTVFVLGRRRLNEPRQTCDELCRKDDVIDDQAQRSPRTATGPEQATRIVA